MKKAIRFLSFCIILFIISNVVLSINRVKNPVIEEYIDDLSNADVLFFGSSHVYVNIAGGELWNQYGISAASLGQPEQNLILTYYTMKEAIKYHKPKLIVVDVYMASANDSYQMDLTHYSNALLSFPFIKSLGSRIDATNEVKKYSDVNTLEYVLGFPIYHSDYKLDQAERYHGGFFNGTQYNYNDQFEYRFNCKTTTEKTDLDPNTSTYVTKIIELSKANNIPLLFIVTPYQAFEYQIKRINTVKEMAEKENIPFLDMNSYVDEIGIDLDTEMIDWGHAYFTGSKKNTDWIGAYLKENYSLPDRRDDKNYKNFAKLGEYYQEFIDENMK